MLKIPFEHFYIEVRDNLDINLFKGLNPHNIFIKSGETYAALEEFVDADGFKHLYINLIVNKHGFFNRPMFKYFKENYDYLHYMVSAYHPRMRYGYDPLAKYYGFSLETIKPNAYSDGSAAYIYIAETKFITRV